jgi:hypothetical protein
MKNFAVDICSKKPGLDFKTKGYFEAIKIIKAAVGAVF